MENSTAQALADFAALVSILTFIIGVVVLIVFFVMAANIGTMTRAIRGMRMEQMNIAAHLSKLAGIETEEHRQRKFDDALDAAKRREQSKI